MDAVEFLLQKERICSGNWNCKDCIIRAECGYETGIAELSHDTAKKLVYKVEQWAKEHPAKTRQSEFLKMFPDAKINDAAILAISPCTLDVQARKDCNGDCNRCRREYWLQEVE